MLEGGLPRCIEIELRGICIQGLHHVQEIMNQGTRNPKPQTLNPSSYVVNLGPRHGKTQNKHGHEPYASGRPRFSSQGATNIQHDRVMPASRALGFEPQTLNPGMRFLSCSQFPWPLSTLKPDIPHSYSAFRPCLSDQPVTLRKPALRSSSGSDVAV